MLKALLTASLAVPALSFSRPFAVLSARTYPWLDHTQPQPLNPFQCAPPVVSASVAGEGRFAIELSYRRDGNVDQNGGNAANNALRYRGTWVYGGFVLPALLAQSVENPFMDLAEFLANSNDTARYDGTCVTAPEITLGAATSLYNFDATFQAADFTACIQTGVDKLTGEVVEPDGATMSAWMGPGISDTGEVAYDTHGWMHKFFYYHNESITNRRSCSYNYGARRVDSTSKLPLSFFSVELSSMRDCDRLYCYGFTQYVGDELIRRIREHRVSRELVVTTEDDLPTHMVEAFAAAPTRYGAVNLITRNVTFVVSIRQPFILPAVDTYEPIYRSAALGNLGCESPRCAKAVPTAARSDMALSVPWSMHTCSAECKQPVDASRFNQPVVAPAARFTAEFDIMDVGRSLLETVVVTRDVPDEVPDDTVPVAISGDCDSVFLLPWSRTVCKLSTPDSMWESTLVAATAVAHLPTTRPDTDMGDTCGLGRASFLEVANGTVQGGALGLQLYVNSTVSPITLEVVNGGAGQAVVFVCVQLSVVRASARRLPSGQFPAFASRAAAMRFDGARSPTRSGRLWVPSVPVWDDGVALDATCAAEETCSDRYPYRMDVAAAKTPTVAHLPVVMFTVDGDARSASVPGVAALGVDPSHAGILAMATIFASYVLFGIATARVAGTEVFIDNKLKCGRPHRRR